MLLQPAAAGAVAGELVMLAPLNHTMPFARFTKGELSGGILKEMGDELGARLQRRVRFVPVPSRRVGIVLDRGEADGVCLVRPGWIDGNFNWSPDLIGTGGVVLARQDAPPVRALEQLRGETLGTVAGYRYQIVGALLGKDFVRDDAPSGDHVLRKLIAGRTRYALMESNMAAWYVKNDRTGSIRLDMVYETSTAQCAFSQRSSIPWPQLRQASASMLRDQVVEKIMKRYR